MIKPTTEICKKGQQDYKVSKKPLVPPQDVEVFYNAKGYSLEQLGDLAFIDLPAIKDGKVLSDNGSFVKTVKLLTDLGDVKSDMVPSAGNILIFDGEYWSLGEPLPPTPVPWDDIEDYIDSSVDDRMQDIVDLIEDGEISTVDLNYIRVTMNDINATHPTITELIEEYQLPNSLKNPYNTAYTELILYIQPFLDGTLTVVTDPDEFALKFQNYYDAKSAVLREINTRVYQNQVQAQATSEFLDDLTDYWGVTISESAGVIVAGTMAVGTPSYNNAGMTGVTNNGNDSIRFWAGTSYANRESAPFRVSNSGKIWIGGANDGFDYGFTALNQLTFRSPVVQDLGGNTSFIGLDRGIYNESYTYYPSNLVTYNGSKWRWVKATSGNSIPSAVNPDWEIYVSAGSGPFVSRVFKRSATVPATPTGGSYSSPLPDPSDGWSDGPPAGLDPLYVSSRIFTQDGGAPQAPTWTEPSLASDTTDITIRWSSNPTTDPLVVGNPDTNPTAWLASSTDAYWWAIRKMSSGVELPWEVAFIRGEKGDDGQSTYTWHKYAEDDEGTNMSDDPTGRPYLGLAFNKTTPIASTNPSDYEWALFSGEGIPGPPGADGTSLYTWIKYTANPATGPVSDSPTAGDYMGIAVNKTTPVESTNVNDYVWKNVKGNQGPQGPQGALGDWYEIRYAINTSPSTPPSLDMYTRNPTGWTTTIPSSYNPSLLQYVWVTRAKISGNTDSLKEAWVTPTRQTGGQGPRGDSADVPLLLDGGVYKDTETYHGSEDYIMYVQHNGRGYHSKTSVGGNFSGQAPPTHPATSNTYWELVANSYTSVETKVLVATTAYIDVLTSKRVAVGEFQTTPVPKFTGTTIGLIPAQPHVDPTASSANFELYGRRSYYKSGRISRYEGLVTNYQIPGTSPIITLNGEVTIVFKDETPSKVFYYIDNTTTNGIQYTDIDPITWTKIGHFRQVSTSLSSSSSNEQLINVLWGPNEGSPSTPRPFSNSAFCINPADPVTNIEFGIKTAGPSEMWLNVNTVAGTHKYVTANNATTNVPNGWYYIDGGNIMTNRTGLTSTRVEFDVFMRVVYISSGSITQERNLIVNTVYDQSSNVVGTCTVGTPLNQIEVL